MRNEEEGRKKVWGVHEGLVLMIWKLNSGQGLQYNETFISIGLGDGKNMQV